MTKYNLDSRSWSLKYGLICLSLFLESPSSSSSSLVTENHQRTDVYFPAHAWLNVSKFTKNLQDIVNYSLV
jgi:hypothetical protein